MQLFILSPAILALRLPSSFGATQAGVFRETIRKALMRAPRELLIDCSQLSYIDSTGLGLLALAQSEATRVASQVKLANVLNSHVQNLLELMHYQQLFPMVRQTIPNHAELVTA